MKIKNYYAWIFAFWILSTFLNFISGIVNFLDGKLFIGFIFFAGACAFAFVSGILLEKAIIIHEHNKTCDFLKEIHKYLLENNEPFEEFKQNEL